MRGINSDVLFRFFYLTEYIGIYINLKSTDPNKYEKLLFLCVIVAYQLLLGRSEQSEPVNDIIGNGDIPTLANMALFVWALCCFSN